MSLSLTKEQSRAGFLSRVEAAAKRKLLDALNNDIKRVVIESQQQSSGGRHYFTAEQNAADVLIDSATRSYEAQEALAQLIVDGAAGADVSIRCKLILSVAVEKFGQDEAERAELSL
jgi:hypothetical protein